MKMARVYVALDKWLDIPMPEGVAFANFMYQARFESFIFVEKIFVKFDAILFAVEIETTKEAPGVNFTKPQGLQ